MNYIEANLTKDEQIIASIKHSWAGLVSTFFGFIVGSAFGFTFVFIKQIFGHFVGDDPIFEEAFAKVNPFFIFCGCLFILFVVLISIKSIVEMKCAQLVVTNKRLLGRRGFISKVTTDILLSKVDTVNAANDLFGAIFHYGTIEVVSAASVAKRGGTRYTYISNTLEFRKAVLDAIDKVKEEEHEAQVNAFSQALKKNNTDN